MKTSFLSIVLSSFLSCSLTNAQWAPDKQLVSTNNFVATSLNNMWCIAASGNYVHAVWEDKRSGYFEIYYMQSDDKGLTWQQDTILSAQGFGFKSQPAVAVSGSYVYSIWQNSSDFNNYNIGFIRSTNNGVTWQNPVEVTDSGGAGLANYSFAASGPYVHIIWSASGQGFSEIYYQRSTDYGVTFENKVQLTNNGVFTGRPTISTSGGNVFLAWQDERDWNKEIYFKRSTDFGASWSEPDVRMTFGDQPHEDPVLASSGSFVHLMLMDAMTQSGKTEIYYLRSLNEGTSWEPYTRLTYLGDSITANRPSAAAFQGNVHLLYSMYSTWDAGKVQMNYTHSTDGGASWSQDTTLSGSSWIAGNSSIAIGDSNLHVIWTDNRLGSSSIYYKTNKGGNIITSFSESETPTPGEFDLHQNYPNPFNPSTSIQYSVSQSSQIQIKIFDVLGNEIETLINEEKPAGTYEINWNAANLPSGVYFYRLQAREFVETKKMILIK